MKKLYEAPKAEIERYSLDASIASNCAQVVTNGPALGDHEQCEDYQDPFAVTSYSARSATYNVWFYEDTNCDCYYSAADGGYWMS